MHWTNIDKLQPRNREEYWLRGTGMYCFLSSKMSYSYNLSTETRIIWEMQFLLHPAAGCLPDLKTMKGKPWMSTVNSHYLSSVMHEIDYPAETYCHPLQLLCTRISWSIHISTTCLLLAIMLASWTSSALLPLDPSTVPGCFLIFWSYSNISNCNSVFYISCKYAT